MSRRVLRHDPWGTRWLSARTRLRACAALVGLVVLAALTVCVERVALAGPASPLGVAAFAASGALGPAAGSGLGEGSNGMVQLEVVPDRAFYTPGQSVALRVEAPQGFSPELDARVYVEISHLTEIVARLSEPVGTGTSWTFWWQPPPEPAGYGLAAWIERGGLRVAYGESAFDVALRWTDQPRYGFLSEFGTWDEAREREVFARMNRLHLNGLQFYDWQYRHEQLVPPSEEFTDSLGRRLMVASIEGRIRLAREYGMAPMAYTAIYASSPSFYVDYKDWALRDAGGKPVDFGNGYLILMNPSRGFGWHDHLLDQFRRVLERFDFDGIHVDQYGYPQVAYDHRGQSVVVAQAFRDFIDDAKRLLSEEFDRNTITFNSETNWPAAVMARSRYDFNYVEVWSPYDTYGDIEWIIREAYVNSGGKPTVIAAYVAPEYEATVRLLNAVIFASGGTHIEMGEGDGMLADPYFPKFRKVSSSLWQAQVKAYDFIVRYKEWLHGPREMLSASALVRVGGEAVPDRPEPGKVHAVFARLLAAGDAEGQEGARYVLSLINFTSAPTVAWTAQQPEPEVLEQVPVSITLRHKPRAVWVASPDGDSAAAVRLSHTATPLAEGGFEVSFTVPRLHYWTVVVLE